MGRNNYVDTGIPRIDEYIIEGIPVGHTVGITGDPRFSSEKVLHKFATTNRDCLYISTSRPEESIRNDVETVSDDTDTLKNIEIVDYLNSQKDIESVLEDNRQIIQDGNIVIDTYTRELRGSSDSVELTRNLYDIVQKYDSVCYLYLLTNSDVRVDEIYHILDGNIRIVSVGYDNANKITNSLYITKMRGINIPEDEKTVIFSEDIEIDTTREIN